MFSKIKHRLETLIFLDRQIIAAQSQLMSEMDQIKETLGRIELRQLENKEFKSLQEAEFKVFSQWGEDGIIQYLIKKVPIKNRFFVEFGVENYKEANTRFLVANNNWKGLVIDGDKSNIEAIKNSRLYWSDTFSAVESFVTKENINDLLEENGASGEIGILSIDIDGNDYWVWEAINVVQPAIVTVEYNHRFGPHKAVTVPYDENFVRSKAHYSHIYFGASLKALCYLANRKGYAFVGCNSKGVNAFFVRRDILPASIKELTPEKGFVEGQHREARKESGKLSYLSLGEEKKILEKLPVVDVS